MEAFKIAIKFYIQDASFLTPSEFVPIYHSWIQTRAIADHILVDVADYGHVPDGPGTVLVAYEANIYADRIDGRLGLTYSRKQPAPGSFADRLRQALAAAIDAAAKLESDPRVQGRLKFRTDEILLTLNDRLLSPNTAQTFKAIEQDLKTVLSEIYGSRTLKLDHRPDPRALFQVKIKVEAAPENLADLAMATPASPAAGYARSITPAPSR